MNHNTHRKTQRETSQSNLTRSTSKLDQKIKLFAKGVLNEDKEHSHRRIKVVRNPNHKRNNTGGGVLATFKNKNNLELINNNPYQNLNPVLSSNTPKTSSKILKNYHTTKPSQDKDKENSSQKTKVFSTCQKVTSIKKKSKKCKNN